MPHDHVYLLLPGPVEVRREILDAQARWMIGHRQPAMAELFARVEAKVKQAFFTENRVYILATTGTGFWEAASRNCVRDGRKVLHLTNGSFSEKWADVSRANGKDVDVIALEWGRAHTPEMVAEAMASTQYDAVCAVHNETSTGVTNPIAAIGEVVHQQDDALYVVDTVSGFMGTELRVDDWGIDVALTSSQKAFALPPGLAFAAVSDRVLQRAQQIPFRGYYFDFLELEKHLLKNNTPSTSPIPLMFAADVQFDAILAEGIETRWDRHRRMRAMTHDWATVHGFGLFAEEGYRSNTVTAVDNRAKGVDVNAMAAFMLGHGYAIDKGYGKIKGSTFRIAHMGDLQPHVLAEALALLDEYLEQTEA
jgi:predicted phosphoserine aminotransferase